MEPKDFAAQHLDRKETREIITPYAFKVHPPLLGLPLASPWRRGAAMLIDGCLVLMAAKVSATLIAWVAAVGLYQSTATQRFPTGKPWLRRALRFGAAGAVFVCSLGLLIWSLDWLDTEVVKVNNGSSLSAEHRQLLQDFVDNAHPSRCDAACEQRELDKIDFLLKEYELNELRSISSQRYRYLLLSRLIVPVLEKPPEQAQAALAVDEPEAVERFDHEYSPLKWSQGLLNDIGLGFGWAAIYFTLFTLLWRGRTPGKKLAGIQVISLSGSPLTLWESFSRYGGYCAGFATGLVGFLQIFWDSNRQAIQDKICGTVVIRGSIPQPGWWEKVFDKPSSL